MVVCIEVKCIMELQLQLQRVHPVLYLAAAGGADHQDIFGDNLTLKLYNSVSFLALPYERKYVTNK